MTTREATGLLSRADAVITGDYVRKLSDRLAVAAFGLIQWPWLLASLDGGRRADKRALLERLDLPPDALPHLGSWKADTGLLTLLVDHVLTQRPRRIVEFGMGASTLILARALDLAGGGSLTSFDQHSDFVEATSSWLADHSLAADLRAVPLTPASDGWPGLWYDHGPLPSGIDLLVVDGPPWTIHPFTRGAAESLFARIAPGGAVILDDGARPGERMIARRWRQLHPEFDFRLDTSGAKGTLIGIKRA
jgi:predicted O-methyltransferase YrrM